MKTWENFNIKTYNGRECDFQFSVTLHWGGGCLVKVWLKEGACFIDDKQHNFAIVDYKVYSLDNNGEYDLRFPWYNHFQAPFFAAMKTWQDSLVKEEPKKPCGCPHKNVVVNHVLGNKFYYCRDCKQEVSK